MKRLILYIAVSLDGYIADCRGSVDWLGEPEEDTYTPFIEGIDTVIMGYRTYDQVVTQLSPDRWPYEGLTTYVLTHRPMEDREGVRFYSGDLTGLLTRLRQLPGRDIWLCGGAEVIRQAVESDQLDRIHLTVAPVTLGSGTALFPRDGVHRRWNLVSGRQLGQFAECIYEKE